MNMNVCTVVRKIIQTCLIASDKRHMKTATRNKRKSSLYFCGWCWEVGFGWGLFTLWATGWNLIHTCWRFFSHTLRNLSPPHFCFVSRSQTVSPLLFFLSSFFPSNIPIHLFLSSVCRFRAQSSFPQCFFFPLSFSHCLTSPSSDYFPPAHAQHPCDVVCLPPDMMSSLQLL